MVRTRCVDCGEETLHYREDMGTGYAERGSKASTHTLWVEVCVRCGAVNAVEEAPRSKGGRGLSY